MGRHEVNEVETLRARSAGFTLIELLAVLAIIALLMSISVMVFGGGAEESAHLADGGDHR